MVDPQTNEESIKSKASDLVDRGIDALKKLKSGDTSSDSERSHISEDNFWVYDSGVHVVPHPEKKDRGGEDAYFIGPGIFGVADGVSSWAKYGIDPGRFSKKLMKAANEIAEETRDPLEILETAFEKTKGSVKGSCTACIVSFNGSRMDTLNLGDSGFIVYRDGVFPICSSEQQHSFNCPYQLGTRSRDVPSDGDKETFEVQDGDIVIIFTDGLSGNLYAEKIAEVIKRVTQNGKDPQRIAEHLAKEAFSVSQDPKSDAPFSEDAKQNGWKREGGKEDDITVLVVYVRKNLEEKGGLRDRLKKMINL